MIFGLLPLIIVTGLSMSPQLNADFPWLPALFGGRQSARTVHFLAAWSLFAFFAVHVVMVVISGFWNNMRSMITGRYAIEVWRGRCHASQKLSRRSLLKAAGGIGAALLAGCDQITENPTARRIFGSAATLNNSVQHALGRKALATEFSEADLSPVFKANGTENPEAEAYKAMVAGRLRELAACRSAASSSAQQAFRSAICARCRPGPRSPGMIASRDGVASANGPERG